MSRRTDGTTFFGESTETHTGFYVPCGQCTACKISRTRMWASRCVHEAQMHPTNSFLTLTYDDQHLPKNGTLVPDHARNFIRRLRSEIKNFKYLIVGEYGDQSNRPHYHALIFGYDFGLSQYRLGEANHLFEPVSGSKALRSNRLADLWKFGHSSVGDLTYDSAAYCAQYSMKKLSDDQLRSGLVKPFARRSRAPIGAEYADQYAPEIIRNGFVLANGKQGAIPPYYLKRYERDGYSLEQLKARREEYSGTHSLKHSYDLIHHLSAKFANKLPRLDTALKNRLQQMYFNGEV